MIMSAEAAGKLAADNPQIAITGVVVAGAVLYLIARKWMDTSSGLLRDAGGAAKDAAKWTVKEVGEFGDYAEDRVEDAGRAAMKVGRSARRASKEAVSDTKSALRGAKRAVTNNRVLRGVKKTRTKAKKAAGKAKKALGRLFR